MRLLWMILLAVLLADPAAGVLIDSGDGGGNTSPPADDPGFAHVGRRGGLTAVYVGNGWVLSAAHVGFGAVAIGGVSHPAVAGSRVIFDHPGGGDADLQAFRIDPAPPLPLLPIRASVPSLGDEVILVGNGRNREEGWLKWQRLFGRAWASGSSLRWGTNRIDLVGVDVQVGGRVTRSFRTEYRQNDSEHEAQGVTGDSGGAVFARSAGEGGVWELAGVIFAATSLPSQPAESTFDGNETYIVDLSHYLDQIVPVVRPACTNGLDDDGDGLADHPLDPGCDAPEDVSEWAPELPCDDGLDGDQDGMPDATDPGCEGPSDPDERGPGRACDDGLDQDGDGLADTPQDPGCSDVDDPSERSAELPCDDGVDDDGDGRVDQEDPGCLSPLDPSEQQGGLVCDDGLDEDGDALEDYPEDPGCSDPLDPSERSDALVCDDGLDNDGDGLVDTGDPGCPVPEETSESSPDLACDDGQDNDGDGRIDGADPGCDWLLDASESTPEQPCDDGLDNDGDGLVDLDDPGCDAPGYGVEDPACDDGRDNDGDGFADWDGAGVGAPDPQCGGQGSRAAETPTVCGIGFELAALLPLLGWLRRRLRGDRCRRVARAAILVPTPGARG